MITETKTALAGAGSAIGAHRTGASGVWAGTTTAHLLISSLFVVVALAVYLVYESSRFAFGPAASLVLTGVASLALAALVGKGLKSLNI